MTTTETSTIQLTEKEIARLKKKARPIWKKKRFIIPVGIIALIVIVSVASSGGKSAAPASSSGSSTATTSSASSSAGSSDVAHKVGDTFTVGEFQYKVNKVSTSKGLGDVADGLGAKPNGIFYVVNVTVKNLDSTASTVDDTLFKLKDGSNEYSASTDGDMYANENNDFFLQQVNPNVSLTGNVVFDMPTNAKGLTMEVSGGMLSGKTADVNLGK